MQARRQWCGIFKVLKKEKNCQPRKYTSNIKKNKHFFRPKKNNLGGTLPRYTLMERLMKFFREKDYVSKSETWVYTKK